MPNFPASLDVLTNPTEFDQGNSGTVPHWSQHATLNDIVEALEAKVGIDSSADTNSLDYKVNNASGSVASKVAKAGDTMTGFLVLHADPDAALKAATKQYVDARAGFSIPLIFSPLGNNLTDATTYFAGMCTNTAATAYGNAKIAIPRAGTIKRLDLKVWVRGTLATNETVSHYLRHNDTTDFGQIDTTYDAANRDLSATGLTQVVAAGDFVALKIVTPTFGTNPTNVQIEGHVFIE